MALTEFEVLMEQKERKLLKIFENGVVNKEILGLKWLLDNNLNN